MKFTKEALLGKKIRYSGEKQWQQIVDACVAVGIPVGKHKGGNCVAMISRDFRNNCVLSETESYWYDSEDFVEEFRNLEELEFPFEDDEDESWDGRGYPSCGTECEYSAMNSDVWYKCLFVGKVGDFVYVDTPHLDDVQKFQPRHIHLRPIQPKWQEVLCKEFDIEYDSDNDVLNFLRGYSESGAIKLAKRIIELSEGN